MPSGKRKSKGRDHFIFPKQISRRGRGRDSMAKCERCGASFDYDERQGVCPRCCFYNRPPGAARQDTEWMKYYNVEDNSYQLPKSEGLADLFSGGKIGLDETASRRPSGENSRRRRPTRFLCPVSESRPAESGPSGDVKESRHCGPGHTVTGKIPAGRLCLEKSLLLWLLSVF